MMKEVFGGFIVGSSIISCAVTFLYMFRAYYRLGCPKNIVPFDKFWIVPLTFGVFNSLNIFVQLLFFEQFSPYAIAFIIGALQGTFLSSIGHFYFHFPRKLFHFKNENYVHLIAIPLYGAIYALIVQPLNSIYILR